MDDTDFEELPEAEPSWLRLHRATAYRKRLLKAGYAPLPVNGKAPPFPGWQDIAATNKIIETWEAKYPDAASTGILTASVPTIDIDIMHPEAATAIEALAREHFEERGRVLVRFGKAPKRAILLRSDESFKKLVRKFAAPNGSGEQRIEVMADGQQVVVFGPHKETGRPYSWHGGEPGTVAREHLPYVCEDDMAVFLDAAAELLTKEFGFKLIEDKRRPGNSEKPQARAGPAGAREKAYAQATLDGCAAELTNTASGSRNEILNKLAFRLGRMVVRGWISRTTVETALLEAMHGNGAIADDGIKPTEATLKSGLDAGEQEPHPDLADDEPEPATAEPLPQYPPCTLTEVHDIFRKWFGPEYDLGTLDSVLAAVAAEKLSGDPPWLLLISGPGNAKTETIAATSGLGTRVVSTITSEGALLSASPRKSRAKTATGGLLRQIGERGVLAIKDFTSIISANREVRMQVLAALREIHDGHWIRNVGTDGGQCLEWRGRIVVIGACTTVWDQAHGVVSTMGDRFILVRSNSSTGRLAAGMQAVRNTGTETEMRQELAAAVAGVIGRVKPDRSYGLTDNEMHRILQAADIVTLARTGVETDYRGDIIDAHAPEMPTRFTKQLAQFMRGALAIGMMRSEAMALAIRCARNSMPPLRLAILEDIAANPGSRIIDVRRRLQRPRATADRALQALHVLGLLVCEEEEEQREDGPRYIRHYRLAQPISLGALSVPDSSVDDLF
jgi:hypothetical protein